MLSINDLQPGTIKFEKGLRRILGREPVDDEAHGDDQDQKEIEVDRVPLKQKEEGTCHNKRTDQGVSEGRHPVFRQIGREDQFLQGAWTGSQT